MDIKDIKVGDTVLIEAEVVKVEPDCKEGMAVRVKFGSHSRWLDNDLIKEVITKPFNWDDVKQREAFRGDKGSIRYYVAPDFDDDNRVVVSDDNFCCELKSARKEYLTRTPEHDIEVK